MATIGTLLGTVDAGNVPDGNLAPNFDIRVNDDPVPLGVRALIARVEHETTENVAEMMKLSVNDPDFTLVDDVIFQEGNEITLRMGYGPSSKLVAVGRAVISKVNAAFPRDSKPMLEITAYSKDQAMMDNAPEKGRYDFTTGQLKGGSATAITNVKPGSAQAVAQAVALIDGTGSKARKRNSTGRHFKQAKWSDAVKQRARDYLFKLDVDETNDGAHDFTQHANTTDYELIRQLSGIAGFLFWIDADESGQWVLHFKDPNKNNIAFQDKKFTFKYNAGDESTLLDFRPERLIRGFNTRIKAVVKNTKTGRMMSVTTEEPLTAPDVRFDGDVTEKLTTDQKSAGSIRLFFNDFSLQVVTSKRFTSEDQLRTWTAQWFRRQRDNFVMGQGTLIGIETLRARQTHSLTGIGKAFSGDYYFSRVRHVLEVGGPYVCDFSARKIVGG